jgi:hypothetical protein
MLVKNSARQGTRTIGNSFPDYRVVPCQVHKQLLRLRTGPDDLDGPLGVVVAGVDAGPVRRCSVFPQIDRATRFAILAAGALRIVVFAPLQNTRRSEGASGVSIGSPLRRDTRAGFAAHLQEAEVSVKPAIDWQVCGAACAQV